MNAREGENVSAVTFRQGLTLTVEEGALKREMIKRVNKRRDRKRQAG